MKPHPHHPNIVVSSASDKSICIWDIQRLSLVQKWKRKKKKGEEEREREAGTLTDLAFLGDNFLIGSLDSDEVRKEKREK